MQKEIRAAAAHARGRSEKKAVRRAEAETAAPEQRQTQSETPHYSQVHWRRYLLHFITLFNCACLFSVQTGEKSRDDALEAIKGNLDGFSRDAKMHPTPSSQSKKPGTVLTCSYREKPLITPISERLVIVRSIASA